MVAVLYLLWVVGAAPPEMDGTRATGSVVVGLGCAASASAVVPGFEDLIHRNRLHLAVTSIIGLAAFVAAMGVPCWLGRWAVFLLLDAWNLYGRRPVTDDEIDDGSGRRSEEGGSR